MRYKIDFFRLYINYFTLFYFILNEIVYLIDFFLNYAFKSLMLYFLLLFLDIVKIYKLDICLLIKLIDIFYPYIFLMIFDKTS